MPLPIGPLIAATAQLGSQAVNAISGGNMNRKNRQHAKDMMNQQRIWALEDWEKQNLYNSPIQQMERYKAAGLNPNLMYGQTNTASPIKSTGGGEWKGEAPQFDASSVTGAYMDTRTKETNIRLLEQQIKNQKAQELNTIADTETKIATTDGKHFDNNLKMTLKDASIEAAHLANVERSTRTENVSTNTWKILTDAERQQLLADQSITESAQRILNMKSVNTEVKQRIQNLIKDGTLKQLDINLKKKGFSWGDPVYLRITGQLLEGKSLYEVLKDLNIAE